jgi:hypothetical protein
MKKKYYVNDYPQSIGDHEVHIPTCHKFPNTSRTYLGEFKDCHEAIREAKKRYTKSNGCIHCCTPCHTT